MKKLLIPLLLAGASGCARDQWRAPLAPPADSAAQLLALPAGGKYKFNAPVNIVVQQGTGNVATPTATGKTKADAAAIGPGSSAASTKPAGTAWWVFGLVAAVGAAVWEWLRRQLSFLPFVR
ncbi:hypothetical protein [Hymenobacter sp.]|uniref:hypothetical protein n=1 Tax=Hymenobacter sp. TaxID=1898978 RepID=UPI00286AD4CF|nr:hypothetical protein [Hymenobacter sp.]